MYKNPRTNTDEFLRNASALSSNFNQPPREAELLRTSCIYFNFWSKKYYDHIGPVLLSRFLSERNRSLPRELVHEIKLVNRYAAKTEEEEELAALERKLSFSPFGVTILNTPAEFERSYSTRPWKTGTSFDPKQRVTCEIPTFLLQDVLPLDKLDGSKTGKNVPPPKRKNPGEADQDADATPKRKRGRPRKNTATPSSISAISPLTPASHSNATVDLVDLEEDHVQEAIRRSIQDQTLKRSDPSPSAHTSSKTSPNTSRALVRTLNGRSKTSRPSKPTVTPRRSIWETECIDLTEE